MLKQIQDKSIIKDILLTFVFGISSAIMGLIMLNMPGFEESHSDLREIALLISLFYLTSPLYIIPLCLLTLLFLSSNLLLFPVFITNAVPLLILWYIYKWIKKKHLSNTQIGVICFL